MTILFCIHRCFFAFIDTIGYKDMVSIIYMIVQDLHGHPIAIMDNSNWNRIGTQHTFSAIRGNKYILVIYSGTKNSDLFDSFFEHICGLEQLSRLTLGTEFYSFFNQSAYTRKRKLSALRLL